MSYKYFNEGLNGDVGKHADTLFETRQDAFLQQIFQYPLRIEQQAIDDVDIPAVSFHIVHIDIEKIYDDSVIAFKNLLSQIPPTIHLILNMDGVRYMHIDAIGPLFGFLKKIRDAQRQLFIVTAQKQPNEIFRQIGQRKYCAVLPSIEQAYEEVQALGI